MTDLYPTKYRVVLDDDTVLHEVDTLQEAESLLLRALNDDVDAYLQTPEDYAEDFRGSPETLPDEHPRSAAQDGPDAH